MKYFEVFGLAPAFEIDEADLRKRFLANSRAFHPDFHTLESAEKQEDILQQSSLNNEAYKVLKSFPKRLHYILSEKGLIGEGVKNEMPQDFLMEMMDINEGLMELEFDYDPAAAEKVGLEIATMAAQMKAEVSDAMAAFDKNPEVFTDFEGIKNYYLKDRYLLRIRENLDKFAGR